MFCNGTSGVAERVYQSESLLLYLTAMWKLSIDNGKVLSGAIFIDFRKALDSVDQNILGYELQACGKTGSLWDWYTKVLLRHRSTHVQNLIDESTTKERRLNQFQRVRQF